MFHRISLSAKSLLTQLRAVAGWGVFTGTITAPEITAPLAVICSATVFSTLRAYMSPSYIYFSDDLSAIVTLGVPGYSILFTSGAQTGNSYAGQFINYGGNGKWGFKTASEIGLVGSGPASGDTFNVLIPGILAPITAAGFIGSGAELTGITAAQTGAVTQTFSDGRYDALGAAEVAARFSAGGMQAIADAVDAAISGKTQAVAGPLFTADEGPTTWTRNVNNWLTLMGVDVTGFGVWTALDPVPPGKFRHACVSPHHLLGAHHVSSGMGGQTEKFVTNGNVVVTVNITAVTQIGTTDILLMRTTQDMTALGITPVSIAPPTVYDALGNFTTIRLPVVGMMGGGFAIDNGAAYLHPKQIATVRDIWGQGQTTAPTWAQRLAFYWDSYENGDSSNALAIVSGTKLGLLALIKTGYGGAGDDITAHINEINAAMAVQGPGAETLTILELPDLTSHAALTTAAHGGIVAGSDARLANARTPTTHAASHGTGQADAITVAQVQVINLVADLAAKAQLSGGNSFSGAQVVTGPITSLSATGKVALKINTTWDDVNSRFAWNGTANGTLTIGADDYWGTNKQSRLDIWATSIFVNGTYVRLSTILNMERAGDSSGINNQFGSYRVLFNGSNWNGSSDIQTNQAYIKTVPKQGVITGENRLGFYIRNLTNTDDLEVACVSNFNGGGFGIGTASPTSNLHVVGLVVYANNAAAIAGGLTAGAFYRTGADPDPVMVVH